MPRMSRVCDQCGAVREAKSDVEQVDGELVEFGELRSGASAPGIVGQAAFYGELRFIVQERGYAEGWAAHKFKEKFRIWPNDPRIKFADPQPPSLNTRNWVRSRAIAWAKVKGRAHG